MSGHKHIRKLQHTPSASSVIGIMVLVFVLPALSLSGCKKTPQQSQPNELVVSAAISLKDAFNEIGDLDHKRNGTQVHFNYGASGELEKQIETGAPADVFASAGAKQMNDLAAKAMIIIPSRIDFVRNSLVLVIPASGSAVISFNDLAKPEVKKIAVGNPKTVPAGQYTEQCFNNLKLLPGIQPKLVYAGDVRQVLDYVVRGEVDAGVVYSSDALSAGDKLKVVTNAPEGSYDLIFYPIAVIKESKNQDAAQKFIDLVLSQDGQDILHKHGFVSVK